MKIATFLYPMFAVALGLHALVLFVPIGGDSQADDTDADVAVSELASDDSPPAESSSALPVPDLNVPTATSTPNTQATGETVKSTAQAGSRVAVLQPTRTVNAQSAVAPTRQSTPRNNLASARSARNASAASSAQSGQTASTPANNSAANTAATNSSANGLPNLSDADDRANTSSASASSQGSAAQSSTEGSAEGSAEGSSAKVRSGVLTALSEALKSLNRELIKALTYSAENTDIEGLDIRREQWASTISRQANTDAIGRIEPTATGEPTQLTYPIENSKQADWHSFRLCLDPIPNDAEVGILFDSEGEIVGEPMLIRSTGYPALNNEILATIADYSGFPADRQSKAYTLTVAVDYREADCVSLRKLL
ncbi:MAG: hypothetical protein HC800_14590 [Phormidesmis sp. RL_2_1]|nr:hypothetical protein [Phormidesmis sp. RL_2_1]